MGGSFMDSGAARLNTPLLAYCNQENPFRDLGVHLLYKTHENRCIKWESLDHCNEQGCSYFFPGFPFFPISAIQWENLGLQVT